MLSNDQSETSCVKYPPPVAPETNKVRHWFEHQRGCELLSSGTLKAEQVTCH